MKKNHTPHCTDTEDALTPQFLLLSTYTSISYVAVLYYYAYYDKLIAYDNYISYWNIWNICNKVTTKPINQYGNSHVTIYRNTAHLTNKPGRLFQIILQNKYSCLILLQFPFVILISLHLLNVEYTYAFKKTIYWYIHMSTKTICSCIHRSASFSCPP